MNLQSVHQMDADMRSTVANNHAGNFLLVEPSGGRNFVGSSYQSGASSHSVAPIAIELPTKKPVNKMTAASAKDIFRVDV